jgi:hypothetical protein
LILFQFYKPETEKTEPNLNQKNQTKPVLTGFYSKNQTKTGQFEPILV